MEKSQDSIIMYTVNDLQKIFKSSRTTIYKLVGSDGFPSIKIGGKILTEKTALEKWIEKNRGKTFII